MTTDAFEIDILTEHLIRCERKKAKLQSRRTFVCDVVICVALIASFTGFFLAIKVCLEKSLHVAVLEMKERVSLNRD